MPISHKLLPKIYRAYFRALREDKLPITLEDQIKTQQEILTFFLSVAPNLKYTKNYFNSEKENKDLSFLPIVFYEDFHPFIDRIWNGEEDVSWPGSVKWFGKSSGTTNSKSKYIPVTEDSLNLNHFNAGRDMFGQYLKNNPNSEIGFSGVVTISGSIQDINEEAGTFAGDISTVLDENNPWWVHMTKVIPYSILKIQSWEERLPALVKYLHDQDVRGFVGTVSWVNVLIEEMIKTYNLKDIKEIWPNLEVFFHGAVSLDPYQRRFDEMINDKNFHYMEIYNASEGFFAFQDTKDRENGMLLLTNYGIKHNRRIALSTAVMEFYAQRERPLGLQNRKALVGQCDILGLKTSGNTKSELIDRLERFHKGEDTFQDYQQYASIKRKREEPILRLENTPIVSCESKEDLPIVIWNKIFGYFKTPEFFDSILN